MPLPSDHAVAVPPDALTGIVTALREELSPLESRVSGLHREASSKTRVSLGRWGGRRVALTHTGVGRHRAAESLRALLDDFPVTRFVAAGVAGGLSPGLEVGEVVVGCEVRSAGAVATPPDEAWVTRGFGRDRGPRRARIVTVDRVLCSGRSKADLWRSLGADGTTVADMETSAWAGVAGERRVPYAVVRSVFDRAEDDLPAFLEHCADPQGGLSRAQIVGRAILRPREMIQVIAMGARMRRCAANLPDVVEKLLAAVP